MARTNQFIVPALLAAALGAATYTGYRAHTRQTAVLDRIVALDACLAARNQQRGQAAKATVSHLAEAVRKNHNLARDVYVLKESEQIQARTKALADTLALLRRQWQQTSSNGLPLFATQLNSYVDFIHRYYPEAVPLTWQPAAGAPLPAALATLTHLEAQVRQYGAEALEKQTQKIGSGDCDLCFTRIAAFAIPTSQTVAPGAVYEARLLLSVGATGLKQVMSADGRPASIDPKNSHGAVRFQVPTVRPGQPDTVRATWRGTIRINQNGRDTVLVTQVPYLIIKRPTL